MFLAQFTCQICSMFDKERHVLVSDCTRFSSSLFSTCLFIVGGWFIYYFYTICVWFGQLSSYTLEYFHFHYLFVHSSRVFVLSFLYDLSHVLSTFFFVILSKNFFLLL